MANVVGNKTIGIIMTYNSSSCLEDFYRCIPKVFDALIVVDDGSDDSAETEIIAKQLGLIFFRHEHMGYGGNIRYGIKKAIEMGAEYMIELHGDGQFDPSASPAALAKIRSGYDFVLGSRFTNLLQPLRDKMSLARYLANIGLSFIDRLILQVPLSEFHTGFRVYSKNLVEKIPFESISDDYLYSFEVIAQAAYFKLRIAEVPVRADYRKKHTSISIWKAAIYSFKTLYVLFLFIAARLGFRAHLFRNPSKSISDNQ